MAKIDELIKDFNKIGVNTEGYARYDDYWSKALLDRIHDDEVIVGSKNGVVLVAKL